MSAPLDRASGPSSQAIEVCILQVPKRPDRLRVRWLTEVDGIFCHFRHCLIPCRGNACDTGLHRLPQSWRGYAAVEALDTRKRCWVPAVLEVTERLWWNLEGRILRGEVWDVYRRPGRRDREECWGDMMTEVDPQHLRTDVDFRAAVARLYRNLPIEWGKWPTLGAPQALAPSVWLEAPPMKEEVIPTPDQVEDIPARMPGESAHDWSIRVGAFKRERHAKGEF